MSNTSTLSNISDSTYVNIESAVNNRPPIAREIYPPLCYPVAVARAMCIILYILTVLFTTIYIGILMCNNKITAKDMPLIEFYTVICAPCVIIILYAIHSCVIRN